MHWFSSFLKQLLKAMFSGYSGVQIFLYPVLLFFWLSHESALASFSTLLMNRIHFLPLVFYFVLLMYVGFMVLKIYIGVFEGSMKQQKSRLEEFYNIVIKLHVYLFITLIVLMIFYVLTKFLSYFYGIELPLKQGVMYAFRLFTTSIILLFYVYTMWLKPFREQHYSTKHCQAKCYIWVMRNPFRAFMFTLIMLLSMVVMVKIYLLAVSYVFIPLMNSIFDVTDISLSIMLMPVNKISSVAVNVFLLTAAFLLSNLLFYPFMYVGDQLVLALHPIMKEQRDHGKTQI